ncbi:hypothetical protein G9A89_015987 [Geosiphon pyriformis]|nr:hypothetical protein G9A89_015987 [Geosiphon pyriformis]
MILGLYASAFVGTCFGQAAVINSMISKTVNSSFFVILDGDFNENESQKSASFKFCLGLGLVNTFDEHSLAKATTWSNSRSVERVIDFILVSENLASTIVLHKVDDVSEFFDTDHKSILVSIGLGGLLDAHLISICRQANRDCDLNTMWKILKKTVIQAANIVFSKIWYNKYNCSRNKESSRFFKLELLIAKVWLAIDSVEASKIDSMVLTSISSVKLVKHLLVIRKKYQKSKYCESKIAKNTTIRKAIDCHMENFCSDKKRMIKSILEHLFCKIVLDHLVVDNELVVEPKKVMLKIDKIMEE